MSSILITGGNSFISKSIIPYLEYCGHTIFSPNSLNLDVCNQFDLSVVFNKEYDLVINCAVKGGRRTHNDYPQDFVENTLMLNNLLYFQNKYKFKLIVFDSGASLDRRNNLFNIKEYQSNLPPLDYYGLFKYTQNKLIHNKLDIYNLRLFNIFSKYGMDDSFIPTCINNCLINKPIEIWEDKFFTTFYGEDLAILINYLICNKQNKFIEYNCGYTHSYKLSHLADLIKKLTNSKSEIIIKKEIGKSYHANCDRLYSLGLPFLGLEKGILECVNDKLNNYN